MDIVDELRDLAKTYHQHRPYYERAIKEIELLRKLIKSTRLPACGCGRRETTARYLKELEQ